jgi:NADPH:quinone reductase
VGDSALQHALVLPAIRDSGAVAAMRPFQRQLERNLTVHMVRVQEYQLAQAKLDRLGRQVAEGADVRTRLVRIQDRGQLAHEAHTAEHE